MWSATFKGSTIQATWRKSRCWPIDQTVFTDDDFVPSILTSTSTPHVPDSFPDQPNLHEPLLDLDKDKDGDAMLRSDSDSDGNTQSPTKSSIISLSQLPPHIHKCIPTAEALAFMKEFTNWRTTLQSFTLALLC